MPLVSLPLVGVILLCTTIATFVFLGICTRRGKSRLVAYRDSDEGDLNDIKTNNIGFFVMCTSPGGANTATQRKTAFKYCVRFLDY